MKEYVFEYATSVEENRITIEAESINDAMIYFAKNIKDVVAVWVIQEIKA